MTAAPRVLAIDDSITIRKLLQLVIAKSNFQLDLAATGQEGVERAQQMPPDLILLDYMLPDMKGSEVCAALRIYEATRGVPVVIMSAKGDDVKALFRDAASVVGYMNKPFTPPQVLSTILKSLARREVFANGTELIESGTLSKQAAKITYTFGQQESGAKALYGRLREGLSRLPEFLSQAGSAPAGMFVAKKLFTPDVLDGILSDFAAIIAGPDAASSVIFKAPSSAVPNHDDSLENLALERLRQREDWAAIDAQISSYEGAFERCESFSLKLQNIQLSDSERRVLSLVGPSRTVSEIMGRSGVPAREALNILYRMNKINLIRKREVVSKNPPSQSGLRSVMIFDRDVDGVQQPLQEFLAQKKIPVVALKEETDLLDCILKERPQMVILEAAENIESIKKLAHNVRVARSTDTTLVAIVEMGISDLSTSLYEAGFHAVLTKPFLMLDFERLLAL